MLDAIALIITLDMGGPLADRIDAVAEMRRGGVAVRIDGRCDSACTLYLTLPQTCVTRRAMLGFHGPTTATKGLPLLPRDHALWSRRMASHYPPRIRRWFMRTGRHTQKLQYWTGAKLIRHGVPECK